MADPNDYADGDDTGTSSGGSGSTGDGYADGDDTGGPSGSGGNNDLATWFHSINITVESNDESNDGTSNAKSYKTWDDWELIPNERPFINLQEPKTELVSVPGTSKVLDYTESLNGLQFEPAKGSWSFMLIPMKLGSKASSLIYLYGASAEDQQNPVERINEIKAAIHGRAVRVSLCD